VEIRVLGISASPRRGNSVFLLEQAERGVGEFPWSVRWTRYEFAGKRLSPCSSCHHCRAHGGACPIDDDFAELRRLWTAHDVILYCVAVYHVGIPAQLKAFFDRLGNSLSGYYGVPGARPLKVVGALSQGCHLFGGQELTISAILHHAVLLNCIPVAGDRPESYLGAPAWTGGDMGADALRGLLERGHPDAVTSVKAAAGVARRCIEIAALIKAGVETWAPYVRADAKMRPLLRDTEQPR
jgi:multimeric flavodoxin WrbA